MKFTTILDKMNEDGNMGDPSGMKRKVTFDGGTYEVKVEEGKENGFKKFRASITNSKAVVAGEGFTEDESVKNLKKNLGDLGTWATAIEKGYGKQFGDGVNKNAVGASSAVGKDSISKGRGKSHGDSRWA